MKIAFWCKEQKELSVSAGMAAIAYITAVTFGHRSLVFHADFGCYELERAFVEYSGTMLIKEELAYFYDSGIDLILNRLKFEGLGNMGVREQMLPLKKGLLYYLPGSTRTGRELYEEMFNEKGKEAMSLLNDMFDVLFVGCHGDINSKVNRLIVNEADVLVVLCEQVPMNNRGLLEEISTLEKKIVFLVGMYDGDSKYTVKDIMKELHIKKDSIGVIPYNVTFRDALTDGSFVGFMDKAMKSIKKEKLYFFVDEIKSVTRKILEKAGLYDKKA